jgi:hypothetical protein
MRRSLGTGDVLDEGDREADWLRQLVTPATGLASTRIAPR